LAVATVLAAAMTTGAGSAHADPPSGWEGADQFDYGRIMFTQPGWFAGRPGNFHTGDVEAEEDDDGMTGFISDWFCRGDARPPAPYSSDPVDPRCKLKQTTGLMDLSDPAFSLLTYDHVHDRATIHLDVDTVDPDTWERTGEVRIDLTIKGVGDPVVTMQPGVFYEEWFYDVTARGTVDGIRISKAKTVIHSGALDFWLDGTSVG